MKKCPLANDYKEWSKEKCEDRLFMVCPHCKRYGSHVNLDYFNKEVNL